MPTIWARLQSVGRTDWFVDFPASFAATPKPVIIGRLASATLCLSDCMTVSNRHVTLEQRVSEDGKRTVVLYETSSNGTFINNVLYQKGQTKELGDGDEVSFPSDGVDSDKKQDYTFVFHVIDESFSSSNAGPKKTKGETVSSEWTFIQEQCDELSKEAARLAATLYTNSDKVKALATLMKSDDTNYKDPVVEVAKSMLTALQVAEARLHVLGDEKTLADIGSNKWIKELKRLGVEITDEMSSITK